MNRSILKFFSVFLITSLFILPAEAEEKKESEKKEVKSSLDATKAMQFLDSREKKIEKWAKIKTKKGTAKHRKKQAEIEKVLDELLDYEFIASYVLGSYWEKADGKERERFLKRLKRIFNDFYLEDAFYDKSYEKKYLERGIKELHIKGVPKNVFITSEIQVMMNKKPVFYEFIYHLTKRGDSYKVIDIEVDGVSLLRNYRDEFRPVLKEKGLNGLIDRIEKKMKNRNSEEKKKKPSEKTSGEQKKKPASKNE